MENQTQQQDFDERRKFDDRRSDDREPGPARAADIRGRCADCWGPVFGTKDEHDQWNHIECVVCGRSIKGGDAGSETEAMYSEAEANMASARVGGPSKYRADAKFVLKLMPDMDRDPAKVDQRIEKNLARGRKRGRLTRHDVPPGTAGYLYAQASALLSGIESLPREMSAISLSDFDFGEPQISKIDHLSSDGQPRIDFVLPSTHRKPSGRMLMRRIGAALVARMASAFACELGMKALLVTRLDDAAKAHDLFELFGELPRDSRLRLEADFPTIAEELEHSRGTFGKWRYFEKGVSEEAIRALVDTDRVWELGKAARVILDECLVVGLNFDVNIRTKLDISWDGNSTKTTQRLHLTLEGGESSVPWDEVFGTRKDNR